MNLCVLALAVWAQAVVCAPADDAQTERQAKTTALAMSLLEEALGLAEQAENPLDRAEGTAMAAATLAPFEPRRALEMAQNVDDCYEKAIAIGDAAIRLAQENEYLGLSVIGRISNRSVAYDKFAWTLLFRARQSVPDAVELAGKINNPTVRNVIQLRVTGPLAAWHPGGSEAATKAALEWVESFAFEASKSEGIAHVAASQARYDLPGALKLADGLSEEYRDLSLRLIAATIAASDAASARDAAEGISSPTESCRALIAVAQANPQLPAEELLALLQPAVERVEQIEDARQQGDVRHDLAVLVAPHDFEVALGLAEDAWPLEREVSAMVALVRTAAADDPERALGLAEDVWYEATFMNDPLQRTAAFQGAAAAFAHVDLARAFAAIEGINDEGIEQACLATLAVQLAPTDPEQAGRIALAVQDEWARAEVLRQCALARAPHGWAQAARLARLVPLKGVRSKALTGVARTLLQEEKLLAAGHPDDVMP